MRIDVRDRDLEPTEALKDYVGLRLMSVLDHLVRHVDGVTVRLADVGSREGATRTRCRMLARLAYSREVRVEETAPGPYGAVDRAAERLAVEVSRGRRSTGIGRGPRRMAGAAGATD